jgi:hypothetical protein
MVMGYVWKSRPPNKDKETVKRGGKPGKHIEAHF